MTRGLPRLVWALLDIPVSSQTLVFSKSSFQHRKISPQTPRALYLNDNVYVGWVQDGHSVELSSFDPDQGAIFYLLEQQPSDQPAPSPRPHALGSSGPPRSWCDTCCLPTRPFWTNR